MSFHYSDAARLASLGNLRDGWHDGDGLAPSPASMAAVKVMLEGVALGGLPLGIYPTDAGGILMEWFGSPYCEVEFGPDGEVVHDEAWRP
jgi:hypothetical protein